MSSIIRAFTLALLCLASSFAAAQSGIKGQITDSEGAIIANARVLVHWDPSSSSMGLLGIKQDVIVVTNVTGHYSADVPPGFYDVFVSATAFTPVATKVRVKNGQSVIFAAKLNADPLISREMGDEFHSASK